MLSATNCHYSLNDLKVTKVTVNGIKNVFLVTVKTLHGKSLWQSAKLYKLFTFSPCHKPKLGFTNNKNPWSRLGKKR